VKIVRNAHGWIEERTLAQSLQVTGERLVKAFDAFFERIASGATAGYPRFKSSQRYPGFGFKAEGQGYRLLRKALPETDGPGYRYGAVHLSGIGCVSLKGRARFHGKPTSAEVVRKGSSWYLSVTFSVEEHALARSCANQGPFVFDAGIRDLMTTLKFHQGETVWDSVANPRWLKTQLRKLIELQQAVSVLEQQAQAASGKQAGFPVGSQLKAAYDRVRSVHKKARNQRHDFYHKLTTWMVERFGHIITEELSVSSMLAQQGKSAGLKRGISDAAWATGLLAKLRYKAEEAGSKYEEVPTRLIKPTRRCSDCGTVRTKEELPLSQRVFVCATCGFTLPRDRNACRNMVRYSLEGSWWGKDVVYGPGTGPETPPEKALALAQGE
jgi:putative transposase